MTLSEDLRTLAMGFHPETGEQLERGSAAHKPEAIRLLFVLAEEFEEKGAAKGGGRKSPKLLLEERQQKNLAEGRPAKSLFSWSEEERQSLMQRYGDGESLQDLAASFERSVLAIAVQLEKAGLMSAEETAALR